MSEDRAVYKTKQRCQICGTTDFIAKGDTLCVKCTQGAGTKNPYGHLIVGIDPDTDKSGYAEYDIEQKKLVTVNSYTFFEIYRILECSTELIRLVRIEAGWLNEKSNWHGRAGQSKAAGERIAKNVGANHETGRKLVEMCEHLDIEYELVRPLGTKNIDARTFRKYTKWEGRTNQDNRDAGMLCYQYK